MSQDRRVEEDRKFVETCLELKLLDDTDAESLILECGRDSGLIAQKVLQRGLLTPSDVDIVQSLQRPDDVVPGYKILELIGKGGMGVVYRAEQLDLERIVALKTILISNLHVPTLAARFEREAKALARLQHPNIVQAINFGKHEGRYYFAMEYVPGRTCEQAVRARGRLPADEVWSIVRQSASGLLHALGQNLIHRDIKPANLILLPPPEGSASVADIVKIADFGLAMFADQGADQMRLTTGDKIMGSPAYMSPEQFGGRDVDFRSDMYSLGATAWHLLFGRPPFQGSSIAAIYREKSQPLDVDPSTLPLVPPEDQMRLLMGLLDPNPNLRPQNYRQLIDAIDALGVDPGISPNETMPVATMPVTTAAVTTAAADTDRGAPGHRGPTIYRPLPEAMADAAVDQQPESSDLANSPTIELAATVESGASRHRRAIGWGVALAALIALAVFGLTQTRSTRGARIYTRVAGNTPLFDGVTLSGWDVGGSMVGAWNTVEAPDSSTAIACTTPQGALTRRLPDAPHPRISLFVWLQPGGGPVDVDFAPDPTDPDDVRGTLRMSAQANQLGEKTSDFGPLDVTEESEALPTVHDRYHVVHIERQPTDWYVFLEERLVGTLPIERVGDGGAIRLVIHEGPLGDEATSQAYFADVQLYELRPRDR